MRINIVIDNELHRRLKTTASANSTTITAAVVSAVEAWIQANSTTQDNSPKREG